MSKDNNEQLNISKTQICKLETLLMTTKIQVIKCRLSQMDNFGTFNSCIVLLLNMILNKIFLINTDLLENGYAKPITLTE